MKILDHCTIYNFIAARFLMYSILEKIADSAQPCKPEALVKIKIFRRFKMTTYLGMSYKLGALSCGSFGLLLEFGW